MKRELEELCRAQKRGRGRLRLQRCGARTGHASRLARSCSRSGFQLAGSAPHDAVGCVPVIAAHRGSDRLRQIGDRALAVAPVCAIRARSRCCGIRCHTATSFASGCSVSPRSPTSTPPDCTVEEREEYEPHIAFGNIVFAGVDYAAIAARRQRRESRWIIVWDGGNNDFPIHSARFALSSVADALRPRQIATHHPGEAAARMADLLVVNKVDGAAQEDVRSADHAACAPSILTRRSLRARFAGCARRPRPLWGRRVLVVEDGPTITMAAWPMARDIWRRKPLERRWSIDPRLAAAPEIRKVFDAYPHIGNVLPAMGYGEAQLRALGRYHQQ